MGLFDSLNISATGMTAERMRMDVVSANLANVNTTRTAEGGAYRRRIVMVETAESEFGGAFVRAANGSITDGAGTPRGVTIAGVVEDSSPLRQIYDPGHPDADANGYVAMPNVNVVAEMTDMISSSRSYEANAQAFNAAKSMASRALELGR